MRINQETRNYYVGNLRQAEQKTPEEVAENLKNGRVFSGKVQFPQDKIAERRKAAQEKAMNIVKAAFAGERILDASVEEMKNSIEKGKDEMLAQKAELNRIGSEKEKLKGTFTANGESVGTDIKNGMFYVEIAGINPQDLADQITVSVTDGTDSLEVTYSPLNYIVRIYERETSSAELKAVVQALYGYYLAASEYAA